MKNKIITGLKKADTVVNKLAPIIQAVGVIIVTLLKVIPIIFLIVLIFIFALNL